MIYIVGVFHNDLNAEKRAEKLLKKINPDAVALELSKFKYDKTEIARRVKNAKKQKASLEMRCLFNYSFKHNVPVKMIDSRFLRLLHKLYFYTLTPFVVLKLVIIKLFRIKDKFTIKIIRHPKKKDFEKALKEPVDFIQNIRDNIMAQRLDALSKNYKRIVFFCGAKHASNIKNKLRSKAEIINIY